MGCIDDRCVMCVGEMFCFLKWVERKIKSEKKGEARIYVFVKFFGEMIKGKGRKEGKKDEGKKGVV